jgi:GMP synthase (glutamine-hydrolysing)
MLGVMTKTAIAIRHVPFEDLGALGRVTADAGYQVQYVDAALDEIDAPESEKADLLIVLGGPIGAYEEDRYPFLTNELRLLDRRLKVGAPILGICLGAQLLARALAARVYEGQAKEIGWGAIRLTDAGRASSLRHLDGVSVLHWHGDTFDLPDGADRLASTAAYPNQAFRIGSSVLGLQFHAEVAAGRLEPWLIGHASELSAAGIDPRDLRSDAAMYGSDLEAAARRLFGEWLSGLDDGASK